THDVCTSVATQFPGSDCFVVPVNDLPQGYDYPREVRFEIEEQELDSYLRAADYLNFANADVVCLQHEYGICGCRSPPPCTRCSRSPTTISAGCSTRSSICRPG